MAQALIKRFWAKVDRTSECWVWKPMSPGQRYGQIWVGGRFVLAHRFAYATYVRPLAESDVVRHRCDNPRCVRPSHLLVGSHADNMADRDARGRTASGPRHGRATKPHRTARGARHGGAKLTAEIVAAIRTASAAGARHEDIGREYGVHQTTVSRIARGATWRAG